MKPERNRHNNPGTWLSTIVGVLLCCASLGVVGCGKAALPSLGKVQFTDGEPVRSGSIEFRNLSDRSSYASRIAVDGGFTLIDKDGIATLPAGDYEVVVVQIVLTEDLAAEAHEHGRTVPRRYADYYTSGLEFSSQADRKSPIMIELEFDAKE